MSVRVAWLGHASVLIDYNGSFTIYIDPWKLNPSSPDADLILITHEHYDHYDVDDIRRLSTEQTRVVAPMRKELITDFIKPGSSMTIGPATIEAVPAYNIGKDFHPKENGWVGYIVTIGGKRIYQAGDTDHIPEMKTITVDLALIPMGGVYTMNVQDAAAALEDIQTPHVIPIHFGDIVGTRADALKLPGLSSRRVHVLSPGESFTLD